MAKKKVKKLSEFYCQFGRLCLLSNPPYPHIHLNISDDQCDLDTDGEYVLEIHQQLFTPYPVVILKRLKSWHCAPGYEMNTTGDVDKFLMENINFLKSQ